MTTRPADSAAPVLAWLIERGQPEGFTPPVYYGTYAAKTKWTTDAFLAVRFESKADAELFIERQGLPARAVQHGFIRESADSAAPVTGKRYTATDAGQRLLETAGDAEYEWLLERILAIEAEAGAELTALTKPTTIDREALLEAMSQLSKMGASTGDYVDYEDVLDEIVVAPAVSSGLDVERLVDAIHASHPHGRQLTMSDAEYDAWLAAAIAREYDRETT